MPCRYCDDKGLECTLDGVGTTSSTTASSSQTDTAQAPPPDPRLLALRTHASAIRTRLLTSFPQTPPLAPAPHILPHSRPQETQEIKTLLAHPVKFNCAPPTRLKPCHWHLSPAFGLTGLGSPPSSTGTVTVVALPTGKGYRELAGGHASTVVTATVPAPGKGKERGPATTVTGALPPCRMCVDCTMDRVLICACPAHRLARLAGHDAATAGTDAGWFAAFRRLEHTVAGSDEHRVELGKWCSVCPSLAEFGCVTSPSTSSTSTASSSSSSSTLPSSPTPAPPHRGCTLRLCAACALVFTDLCGNDLQQFTRQLQAGLAGEEPNCGFWPLGLRADWDFFARDGGLVRQVLG